MAVLDLNSLFLIAEANPLLELVERAVMPHRLESTLLGKLQADAGVQIDREINGFDPKEPAPGPQTAMLNRAFSPVTEARLIILAQAYELLGDEKLKNELLAFMQKLHVPPLPWPGPQTVLVLTL